MLALVDCNNFYASCEKLFNPAFKDKPLIVLSNNDGCAVSRSAEAKALGIKMAGAWHKMRDFARQHGVIACSSNYPLYANMSDRVVNVLRDYSPSIEVYSIDESFVDLHGFTHLNLTDYGQHMRQRIARWVGLPVCVGIAPTKTLAKLSNHIAKKQMQYNGVLNLADHSPAEIERIFRNIEVGEVWGVGRCLREKLQIIGISTVAALRSSDPTAIRRRFGVVLERTVRELQGMVCMTLEDAPADKQQIISSRSFGRPVTELSDINEALASYITLACEKLRQQQTVAGSIAIWLETNPFNPKAAQYSRSITIPLPAYSDDTRQLIRVGLWGLMQLYREGFEYKKCGCMLGTITPKLGLDDTLVPSNNTQNERTIAIMDRINRKYGRGTLKSAAEGSNPTWRMRRGNVSPAYTTKWEELMVVK
ncbi:MAG: Y-family DNA polymerase [Rhodocyclaceae bacterium]|nr:Y-family DNA polymerase [Rhodocyclaceae bacterium]